MADQSWSHRLPRRPSQPVECIIMERFREGVKEGLDEPSRDRKGVPPTAGVPPAAGAVFAPQALPLPHGRGSERCFLNTL